VRHLLKSGTGSPRSNYNGHEHVGVPDFGKKIGTLGRKRGKGAKLKEAKGGLNGVGEKEQKVP